MRASWARTGRSRHQESVCVCRGATGPAARSPSCGSSPPFRRSGVQGAALAHGHRVWPRAHCHVLLLPSTRRQRRGGAAGSHSRAARSGVGAKGIPWGVHNRGQGALRHVSQPMGPGYPGQWAEVQGIRRGRRGCGGSEARRIVALPHPRPTGGFSRVLTVRDAATRRTFAIKEIRVPPGDRAELEAAREEVAVLVRPRRNAARRPRTSNTRPCS